MLGQDWFYHESIKNYIISFSHMLNDIHVQRSDSEGTLVKDITIPISYGQKQKLFNLLERNSNIDRKLDTFFPRIDFTLESMSADPTRQKNAVRDINSVSTDDVDYTFNGVAYNFVFSVDLVCKYLGDLYQALEQILSLFNPDYQNLNVDIVPELEISHNVKIVLDGVETDIDVDLGEEDMRSCNANFTFTLQGYIYKPIRLTPKIKDVIININDYDTDKTWSILTSTLNDDETITETIEDFDQFDIVIPELTEAIIPESGTEIQLVFSDAVTFGGGGNDGWSLSSPTSTMTYNSGDGSNTLVYDLAVTISSTDVPTVSYVQPGDGVESLSGGDLVSITNASVTNNVGGLLFENDFTTDPIGPYDPINSDYIDPSLTVESIIFGDTIQGVITADGYTAQPTWIAGICFDSSGDPSTIVTNFSFSDTNSYWIFHKINITTNEGMGVRFHGTASGISIEAANYPGVMDDEIITGVPATWIDKQITCETTLTGSSLNVTVTYESSVIYTNTVTLPVEGDNQSALLTEDNGSVQYFSLT